MKQHLNQFLIEIKNNSASTGTPIHDGNYRLVEELRLCKFNLITVRGRRIFLSEMAERNFDHILKFKGEPSEYPPPFAEVMLKSHPQALSTIDDLKKAWGVNWVKTVVGVVLVALLVYFGS
ncbi:MAG TPA: hypothetical protein VKZ51_12650 [Cyclobacteriaceae bacterium]|nr:hypothetical protein [Cyclobacteriaceae bacterium]